MKRPGFTILEMLVVAAAFSVIFLVSTTVYANATKSQRTVSVTQRVTSSARYLVETLAREIRTKPLDYEFYDNSPAVAVAGIDAGDKDVLAVKNSDTTTTCFLVSTSKIRVSKGDCTDWAYTQVANNFTDITPNDLQVMAFQLYSYPSTDPFRSPSATYTPPNIQPHVTIYLQSRVAAGGKTQDSFMQTTVVSRIIKR